MIVGSLFSGIGAPECAWRTLGWRFAWCAEIEPSPCSVLRHHYPDVPNLGDVTKVDWNAVEPIDLLVAGSPCQSFSVAGKRLGLDDARGNLALVTLAIARRLKPRWIVFENVPGLLSSDEGRDFGIFLGHLAECGYGFAYRVLDAQHFGVPQRRRRLFVVGHLGDWRRAATVLFERESLSGHSAPGRQERADTTGAFAGVSPGGGWRTGADEAAGGQLIATGDLARQGRGPDSDGTTTLIAATLLGKHNSSHGEDLETYVTHTLRGDGFDASEDGTGRGTPLVARALTSHAVPHGRLDGDTETFVIDEQNGAEIGDQCGTLRRQNRSFAATVPISESGKRGGTSERASKDGTGIGKPGDPMFTVGADSRHAVAMHARQDSFTATATATPPLDTDAGTVMVAYQCHGSNVGEAGTLRSGTNEQQGVPFIAFDETQITSGENRCNPQPGDPSHPLPAHGRPPALAGMTVRRLTPTECERLQGFPDGYTDVAQRGKPAADGPRYKALGNSMAVPVVRWIGERVAQVDAIPQELSNVETR